MREIIEAHPKRRLELPRWTYGQSANLEGADLKGLRLTHANLEGANLTSADLANCDLRGTVLTGAMLHGAVLREARLQRAKLSHAKLYPLSDASPPTDLMFAQLQGAALHHADLRKALLYGAKLQGAEFTYANLEEAHLEAAELEGVDLSNCRSIKHIYLAGAVLGNTIIKPQQLNPAGVAEQLDAEDKQKSSRDRAEAYGSAKDVYSTLKQNFDGRGDYDEASWAYRKERRMEKLQLLHEAHRLRAEGKPWSATRKYVAFAVDQLVEWVCDYGENPRRVFCSLIFVFLFFTLLYGATNGVVRVEADAGTTHVLGFFTKPCSGVSETDVVSLRDLPSLTLYSLGSMTTMVPDKLEPRHPLIAAASSVEALFTIALTGLFGFVLGNRIRRS